VVTDSPVWFGRVADSDGRRCSAWGRRSCSTHDDPGPALPQPEPQVNGIALADRATRRTWVEF
jgi:hypothetical protein